MNSDFHEISLESLVQEALKHYSSTCQPDQVHCFKSHSANTNQVFLIIPKDKKEPFVLRIAGNQTHGMIDPLERFNHDLVEQELLQYLNKNAFYFVPKIFTNNSGEYVTKGEKGIRYSAFSYMPGEQIGSFNHLLQFNPERRKDFFQCIGKMSCILSNYRPNHKPTEITLNNLNNQTFNRLEKILIQIENPIYSEGKKLLTPYISNLRIFGNTLSLDSKLLALTHSQLCHFDLHIGNALFEGNKLTAILDWDWCRIGEWYGIDWASAIAMCCYHYDADGGELDGVYDSILIKNALLNLQEGFGKTGRLPLDQEKELLIQTFKSYVFAQFLFTCEHYLDKPEDNLRFVDMRHFLYLIIKNDFSSLIK